MKENDFEGRLEEAKRILEKLMQPDLTLEEGVRAYEEGTRALKAAQQMLEKAQRQIEAIRAADAGDTPS